MTYRSQLKRMRRRFKSNLGDMQAAIEGIGMLPSTRPRIEKGA